MESFVLFSFLNESIYILTSTVTNNCSLHVSFLHVSFSFNLNDTYLVVEWCFVTSKNYFNATCFFRIHGLVTALSTPTSLFLFSWFYKCNFLVIPLFMFFTILVPRVVHGLVRIGFGSNPNSTRLDWVTEFWTHIRPNIRVGFDVSSHQLGRSELLISRLGFEIINLSLLITQNHFSLLLCFTKWTLRRMSFWFTDCVTQSIRIYFTKWALGPTFSLSTTQIGLYDPQSLIIGTQSYSPYLLLF